MTRSKGEKGRGAQCPRKAWAAWEEGGRTPTSLSLVGRTQLLQVSRFLKSRLRLKTALVIKHTQEAGFSLRLSLLKGFKNLSGAGGGGKPQAVTTKF